MSVFGYMMIISIAIGSLIGYRAASNDLLHQVFLLRKFSHRLTEFLCAVIIFILLFFYSSSFWLKMIPLIVSVSYIVACAGFTFIFKHIKVNGDGKNDHDEIFETILCTMISILIAVGCILLLCFAITNFTDIYSYLNISTLDKYVCNAIILGVVSILLVVLAHYLIFLKTHPNDSDNPTKDLLKLRKKLHSSHRI